MRNRSLSYPGRFIARYASVLPSGENAGNESHAGLAFVRFLGGAEPSIGARNRSKLVDHASSRPTSRAAKTIAGAIGVNVYSSIPPNGFDGASASIAFITSTRLASGDRHHEEMGAAAVSNT